jgi:acyl carrier protein
MDLDLESKVFRIVAEATGKDISQVSPATALVGGLGMDSAAGLLLLVELEDAFGVTISDKQAASMVTAGDIVDCLRELTRRIGVAKHGEIALSHQSPG